MGQTSDSALMQLTPFVPLDVFYDVYLAQKGLKPAASFQILVGREREGIGEMALNLKAKVDSIMGQMNMVSKSEIQRSHIRLQYKGSSEWVVFTQINLDYLISPTDEGLDRLISANSLNHGMGLHTKEFYISFGLALGYPAEAVNLFASLMHMGISPGAYDTTCILEAIQKGIEIPSWLPYIPYTLGAAELTEKIQHGPSMQLGERYRTFVQKDNPSLAIILEEQFGDSVRRALECEGAGRRVRNLPLLRAMAADNSTAEDIHNHIRHFSEEMAVAYGGR